MPQTKYGYIRVSSKDQSSHRQIAALTAFGITENNLYIDIASGRDFDREEYKKLKKTLKPCDTLVIKSIDRLGRNYKDITEEWKILTKELGVHIQVIDIPLLDTNANGKDLTGTFIADLVLQILSYVAEQERVNIRQRQAEGIAAAKSRGVHLGRPRLICPANFDEVYRKYKSKQLSYEETLATLGMKKSSFYNYAKNRPETGDFES